MEKDLINIFHVLTYGTLGDNRRGQKFHAKSGRPGSVIHLQSIPHSASWTQYLFLFLERENSISNRDIKCRKSRVIGMPNTSTMFCLARGRRRLWGMMRSLWNSDGNFYTTPIILKLLCVCVHLIWFFASFEKKHPRLLVKRNVWQQFKNFVGVSTKTIYFWIKLVWGF